jgi:hypothetical protein
MNNNTKVADINYKKSANIKGMCKAYATKSPKLEECAKGMSMSRSWSENYIPLLIL